MTTLPDWLVERVALDEVPPGSRERVARADAPALAARVAALRAADAAELAAHPAPAALAQIEAQIVASRRRARQRRRTAWISGLAAAVTAAAVVLVVARHGARHPAVEPAPEAAPEITRTKGPAHLVVFRQSEPEPEKLRADAVVHAGDLVQLRYVAGDAAYGVIASLDGAGVVTLHFPASEDAPARATQLAPTATALPHAYALDDAPRFERFVFITADAPIEIGPSLAALRTLAQRPDAATAPVELPAGLHQWSLRLRKHDRTTPPRGTP